MKFSVLMSVYNKEKSQYLDEAISSIINQTQKPNQIVIIKDGKLSRDLDEIIEKYEKEYPDLIDIYAFEENRGLAIALNKGLELCMYEYVARMDSDDVALKDRFEKQILYLEQNPDIDILGGWIEEYDENLEKRLSIRKVPLKDKEIKEDMKRVCPFNHSTVIYKKSKVLKISGYKSIKLEDYDLWARMMIEGYKMENLMDVLVKNRTGKTMYKKRSGVKYVKGIIKLEKRFLNYNIINKIEFISNVVQRSALALSPIWLKSFIYPKIR